MPCYLEMVFKSIQTIFSQKAKLFVSQFFNVMSNYPIHPKKLCWLLFWTLPFTKTTKNVHSLNYGGGEPDLMKEQSPTIL